MTTTALIMMIVAMLTLWGGLAASIDHLVRTPEVVVDEGDDRPAERRSCDKTQKDKEPRSQAFCSDVQRYRPDKRILLRE